MYNSITFFLTSNEYIRTTPDFFIVQVFVRTPVPKLKVIRVTKFKVVRVTKTKTVRVTHHTV